MASRTKLIGATGAGSPDPGSGAGQDRPLAAYLKVGADGAAMLEGMKCAACGEVMVGRHRACPKCTTIGALTPVPLASRGKLYCYSIVHRSFPGVRTPIISAIVRLDDGAFVRGNLEGVAPDPAALPFDLPVRIELDYIQQPDGGDRLVRPIILPA